MNEQAEILARLVELSQEVRRQAKTSLAAQAAAEACLDALRVRMPERDGSDAGRRWLTALLPALDALDRTLSQVGSLEARAAKSRGFFGLGLGSTARALAGEIPTVARGLELLREQLGDALERLGVEVIAPHEGPVDAARHRIVEVRAAGSERQAAAGGAILELVRAGYALDGEIVREAEVVASAGPRRT